MRPRGSKNLRPEVVAWMRELRRQKFTLRAIADLVGCDHTAVMYRVGRLYEIKDYPQWLVNRGAGL
jgi:hypothetical protein